MNKQYYLIDVFKFLFCLCVVAIHTSLLRNCSDDTSFWVTQLLFRLAVPFFFIASGFMLGSKITPVDADLPLCRNIIKKYCVRQLKLLVFFEIIILFLNGIRDLIAGKNFLLIFFKSSREIIFYPRGALWFLQACIIGSLIYYLFVRFKKQKLIFPVGISLYIFALSCNSYNFLFDEIPFISNFLDQYLYYCISARNGVFVGFLYIALGIYCYKLKIAKFSLMKKNVCGWLCLLFFSLYFVELYVLKVTGGTPGKDDFSLFVFLPIFIFFFVCFLSHFEKEKSGSFILMRNLSTGIYLLHSPISLIVYLSLGSCWWYSYRTIVFFLVSLICFSICMLAYRRNVFFASYLK